MRKGIISWIVDMHGDVAARRRLRRARKRDLLRLARRIDRLRRRTGFPVPRASNHKFVRQLELGNVCGAMLAWPPYRCTRALPHSGDHVARVIIRGDLHVAARWPSDNAVALAERSCLGVLGRRVLWLIASANVDALAAERAIALARALR